MKLQLTLTERVLILSELMPRNSTKEIMAICISITNKLKLTPAENSVTKISRNADGSSVFECFSAELAEMKTEYEFTADEMQMMKDRINYIDKNGMFSASNYELYVRILAIE